VNRRVFITLLGGAAATWPLAGRAQQPAMPVIGYLGITSPDTFRTRLQAFRQGLSETGYFEGRNVSIQYRWAEAQVERLPGLVADLVSQRPEVLVTAGAPTAGLVAKAATTKIPIVFETGSDPIVDGLVSSLSHPEANITGVTSLNVEVRPKRLEILHELVPNTKIFVLLVNPRNSTAAQASRDLRHAAQTLGLELHILEAISDGDFDGVFEHLARLGAGGLIIATESSFLSSGARLATLALRHGVPAIFYTREFTLAGGLASYGGSITESHRLSGVYAGRILKGAKPSDLPVQQVTKVELIINMNTAKALGLTVPPPLLARADEVIE
jgi:putative tryptophan/tyrosine transport system substrate-binding protein